MRNQTTPRYMEKLPERFSVRRKSTKRSEQFHRHQEPEILFALSDMICRFETGEVEVPKHSMILLNPLDLHCIISADASGNCERYVLYFSPNYISAFSSPEVNLLECFMIRQDRHPVVLTFSEEQRETVLLLMTRMEQCHKANKGETAPIHGAALELRFLLGELLLLINRLFFAHFHLSASPISLGHAQLVFDISDYIRHHYQEPLSTGSIANTFYISKTQLYNIFKESTGYTVSDFITECRITQAKNLLINTDYSVEMISGAVGYSHLSSFSRTFKTIAKMSPLQYRKKLAIP